MISIGGVYLVLLGIFIFVPTVQILINPVSISEAPSSKDSMSVVDRTASESIALFAIVLVIIQFVLEDTELSYYQELTVGILTLCAGFLMLTFILELFSDVRVVLFHLQITALRYSGLLLFSGLFFLLQSYQLNPTIQYLFAGFVLISWGAWIFHELKYLFRIQLREWNSRGLERGNWFRKVIRQKVPFVPD
ncbi:hypothetical protein HJTV-2_gp57 [Haloarcula virus HJTV-2]|uniref:Uncharacterized protein n=1 Tax=Haloarcula virus HJTV-2 TaxID=2877986 RepID=A0AAE8XW19_9CAUD|nr:hypothetical protein M1M33_gp090 [Haloarcula virus HJTV-2]UBF21537.1 hypothetical protein HRTV-24_gp51 [Halorubrum virus HRTV-24]UBF21677.1 hypothetical protein HJTV-2_gp57 [Haloarcula virus HJTV-2]